MKAQEKKMAVSHMRIIDSAANGTFAASLPQAVLFGAPLQRWNRSVEVLLIAAPLLLAAPRARNSKACRCAGPGSGCAY
jgi:hypothetical protein